MASLIPSPVACRHSGRTPFRGMRRAGFIGDEAVVFACPVCGAEWVGTRCVAVSGKTGGRCRNVARVGGDTCTQHWMVGAAS